MGRDEEGPGPQGLIVLDASLALAYGFADETTPAVQRAVDLALQEGAVVVSFWHIEVANSIEMAVRRGRVLGANRDMLLEKLQEWPISVDTQTAKQAWNETRRIAERHRLTLYDAAYLELAMRLGIPLATLDRELRTAASRENVALLGL